MSMMMMMLREECVDDDFDNYDDGYDDDEVDEVNEDDENDFDDDEEEEFQSEERKYDLTEFLKCILCFCGEDFLERRKWLGRIARLAFVFSQESRTAMEQLQIRQK